MAAADLPAFIRLLGVNVLHRSPERSEAELPVRAELCNRHGVLHGGAVMALGDTLGGLVAAVVVFRRGCRDANGHRYRDPQRGHRRNDIHPVRGSRRL